jgi:hypothetical protein
MLNSGCWSVTRTGPLVWRRAVGQVHQVDDELVGETVQQSLLQDNHLLTVGKL